jgi:hypothetical protein
MHGGQFVRRHRGGGYTSVGHHPLDMGGVGMSNTAVRLVGFACGLAALAGMVYSAPADAAKTKMGCERGGICGARPAPDSACPVASAPCTILSQVSQEAADQVA